MLGTSTDPIAEHPVATLNLPGMDRKSMVPHPHQSQFVNKITCLRNPVQELRDLGSYTTTYLSLTTPYRRLEKRFV